MIQCNCTYAGGRVVNIVKWYNPVDIRLISPEGDGFNANVPYFTRVTDGNSSNIILVIPTFNYSYDGTYNCGRRINRHFSDILGTPNAAVTLTTVGGLMINTVCT